MAIINRRFFGRRTVPLAAAAFMFLLPQRTTVFSASSDRPHPIVSRRTGGPDRNGIASGDELLGTTPIDEVVLHAAAHAQIAGGWVITPDATAAGGARLQNPDAGVPKLASPVAAPALAFDLTFTADAGRPYRLWLRARALNDRYTNDSVFVQFDNSVTASGTPAWRIGTTSATTVVLEDCSGAGEQGWGWADNGYGYRVLGALVYFAQSGPQRLRIQAREDGLGIDQVVLSAVKYLNAASGATKNDATILPDTSAPPPPDAPPGTNEVVLYAGAQGQIAGGWIVTPDATAAGGARLQNPDAGVSKVAQPLATPALSFDLTFTADAGRAYRLWIRGSALNDRYTNDSVFVQFDNSVNAAGAPVWRIGSISATTVVLEDCSGCGLQGWGWADNGYGSAGPLVHFARSGLQRMRIQVREDGIAIDQVVLSAAKFLGSAPGAPKNDATILLEGSVQPGPSIKLAFWNIKAGAGQVGLAGHPVLFASNSNCTDPTKPLNAWGVGMVQAALIQALGNDPNVVALGLAEAWSSTCASAEKIRQVLGWKAKGGIQNGLTIVARYGFAGPEEWEQLDTSLNANPADTMWVVRAPVCVDAACTRPLVVYVAHWMNTNPDRMSDESTNRQAQQTVSFMQQTSGGLPHVLIGDLNVPEGPAYVCGQRPDITSLNYLRAAGYVDAWPTVHGTAEGYTGMTNRVGCGIPEGYAWKRIDDAWSPPSFRPLDMQRFAMVPGGDASPSDHYGIIVTYPDPASR